MLYTIEVLECITSQFEVDAPSSHEAMKIIARKYYDEALIVESSTSPDVIFRIVRS